MNKKEVEELIETHDKQIEKEVKKIEESEERIEDEEDQILVSEKKIINKLQRRPFSAFFIQPGTTAKELGFFHSAFIRKFSRRRRFIFTLIVTIAIVLIWRGIWGLADEIPILSLSLVSLVIGIVLIWLLQKYTDLN